MIANINGKLLYRLRQDKNAILQFKKNVYDDRKVYRVRVLGKSKTVHSRSKKNI